MGASFLACALLSNSHMDTSLQILPSNPLSAYPTAKKMPATAAPKVELPVQGPKEELSTSVPEGTEKTWPNSGERYIEYELGDLRFAYLVDDHANATKDYAHDQIGKGWEAGNIIVGLESLNGTTLNSIEELKGFSESLSGSSPGMNLDDAQEIGSLLHEHAGRPREDFSSIDLSSASSKELEEVSEYLLLMGEVSMDEYRIMKEAASDADKPTDFYQYFQQAAMDSKGRLQIQNSEIASALKALRAPAGGLNVRA